MTLSPSKPVSQYITSLPPHNQPSQKSEEKNTDLPAKELPQFSEKAVQTDLSIPIHLPNGITTPFSALSRYQIGNYLGGGSYGRVYQAIDTYIHPTTALTHRVVALKFFSHASTPGTEGYRNALSELRMLESARGLPNVLQLRGWGTDYITDRFFIATELLRPLQIPPHDLIQLRQVGQGIFRGLAQMHRRRIVHADLKNSHCLLNERGEIVLADLGMSHFVAQPTRWPIQTAAFRDPHVFINSPYDQGIDMWSAGCILYLFFMGKEPFPGLSQESLARIYKENQSFYRHLGFLHSIEYQLGHMPRNSILSGRRHGLFYSRNPLQLKKLPKGFKIPQDPSLFSELIYHSFKAGATPQVAMWFHALMRRMLTYGEQISAEEALSSPFFTRTISFKLDGCLLSKYTHLDIYDQDDVVRGITVPLFCGYLSPYPQDILCQKAARNLYRLVFYIGNTVINEFPILGNETGINLICLDHLSLPKQDVA